MIRYSYLLSLVVLVYLFSCKKDKAVTTPVPGEPETCIGQRTFSGADTIEGEYIVVYGSATGARGLSKQSLIELNKTVLLQHSISPSLLKESFTGNPGGFTARLSKEEVVRLKQDKNIQYIEPDRIITLSTCFTVAEPRLITWNIERVGYGDGTGKRVWVIDTGIDFDHPDLTVNTSLSRSFLPGQPSADDENGHGTHVAGVIGGKNNTFGVLGVASGATLISLRVLDKNGEGKLSYIIQAMSYINSNAMSGDVVNMSLGENEGVSEILDAQIRNTAAKQIYFSIAAGNEHTSANKYSPSRVNGPNIYTVSAIDSLDNFASFSNYGNDVVDYAVPGVRILSTYTGNRYAYMSGTSMAAPHMAGLLALKGNNITTSGFAKNDPDGTPDPIAHY